MESCYQPDGESEGPGDGLPQAGKDIQHETGSASFAGKGREALCLRVMDRLCASEGIASR